jgi:hypothetical protein
MRIFSVLVVVGGLGLAHEQAIKKSEVPAPVLDAVARKYPHARLSGFSREAEQSKVTFEVQVVEGTRHIDIDVSPEGKILAEEETIPRADLPAAVRKALAESARYRGWTVQRVERVVTDENEAEPSFELQMAHGRQKSEIVFDKDGRLTHEERKSGS